MFNSVQNAFLSFTIALEGSTTWMYQDVKGLVTTGYGNLIDSPQQANALTWYHKSGAVATASEVAAEWATVKAVTGETNSLSFWRDRATLNLSILELNTFALVKLKQFEAALKLKPQFKNYESWPADAQLAVNSMCWAMGPDRMNQFVNFLSAVGRADFLTAATQCEMDATGNPGLRPRNKLNKQMFVTAAAVIEKKAPASILWWPWRCCAPGDIAV